MLEYKKEEIQYLVVGDYCDVYNINDGIKCLFINTWNRIKYFSIDYLPTNITTLQISNIEYIYENLPINLKEFIIECDENTYFEIDEINKIQLPDGCKIYIYDGKRYFDFITDFKKIMHHKYCYSNDEYDDGEYHDEYEDEAETKYY